MRREIRPELLDELPVDDPRAMRSRFELRRVNAWMRHPAIVANALRTSINGSGPMDILDIGGGDGDFLAGVGARLRWRGTSATLLDRQPAWQPETLAPLGKLGWHVNTVKADLFEWLNDKTDWPPVVMSNLFLHHFPESKLTEFFAAIAKNARLFIAAEPRRGAWPLFCARMLWVIGCQEVTRHDAAVSVRAGFVDRELSALWPRDAGWKLEDRPAGLFSQLFIARRDDL